MMLVCFLGSFVEEAVRVGQKMRTNLWAVQRKMGRLEPRADGKEDEKE